MFVQRKTTELYQNLHSSLVQWQTFSPNESTKQKPFFVLLTHPHCMWTAKLCAEAFTNPAIVHVLQENFIPCLLDEHTDPELYLLMNQSLRIFLKEQNIRPGCIFVHGTGEPFFGGGYHPPSPRYGMPSFIQFLHHAIQRMNNDSNIASDLQRHNTPPKTLYSWSYSWDTRIDTGYEDAFDFMNHGFGIAPKYLNIARLQSWFSFSNRKQTVINSVQTIITSPVLDPINGCVYRKCEDALWELPVREALLHDQAALVSLMIDTQPNTPCITFLLEHIQQQYMLENGLFLQSISYHPPDVATFQSLQWKEGSPHFRKIPSEEDCTELMEKTNPNFASKDRRAICSSNAKLLRTLIQHHTQSPTEKVKQQIIMLEQSIWNHFGWNEAKEWYHTAHQKMPATGLDVALVIQAMLAMNVWKPTKSRHQEILTLVAYWEGHYLDDSICYSHPNQRFVHRGVDLIADNCASAQEEAAYTLTLLERAGIPTKSHARSFIQHQQWLLYKNPKILSTALRAWKQVNPPMSKENTYGKTILAFWFHSALSHRLLAYTQEHEVILWAQCEMSQQYLSQHGYTRSIIKPVSWDLCNTQGHLHTGPLHPQDVDIFCGSSLCDVKKKVISAFSHKKVIYLHSTYTIKNVNGVVLLRSASPIVCFCFYEDTYWWITRGKLHSSESDTPHTLPTPITTPISISVNHGSVIITQREDLWLFHILKEQFGRYAGRGGAEPKDGLVHDAVFQNITSTCTFENYILVSDAYSLRIIDTKTHMVQTLGDHPPFLYASSIIMFNKNIYIADCIQQCVWQYSLEQEYTKKWDCNMPKSIHLHDEKLWVLCQDAIVELRQEHFC